MKVTLSPQAREDLDAIRRWIARDNRPRAISFVRELVAQIKALSDWPGRFPEADPIVRPGLRRLNHCGYRIFYIVEDDGVKVLHVHHGARGMPDA